MKRLAYVAELASLLMACGGSGRVLGEPRRAVVIPWRTMPPEAQEPVAHAIGV